MDAFVKLTTHMYTCIDGTGSVLCMIMSVHFVSYSVARGSYILMTVMCMQPLNFLHVHLLRLTPQCVAFV